MTCHLANCKLHDKVTVDASDLRHLLDVYIENGMVEDEDMPIIDRLWSVLK